MKVARSANRVSDNTAPEVQQRIERRIVANVHYYAAHPENIDERLDELDEEWDVERTLQLLASSFTLTGLTFGTLSGRRWMLLPFVVQAFFLQHALQGWCPPLPVLRRLGVRTRFEIERERQALRALRGDFEELATEGPQSESEQAAMALH